MKKQTKTGKTVLHKEIRVAPDFCTGMVQTEDFHLGEQGLTVLIYL